MGRRLRRAPRRAGRPLAAEISIIEPPGGHAISINAASFYAHIPRQHFPGQALVCALYRHTGIRGVEIGSVMFHSVDPDTGESIHPLMELVRLAIPRRFYPQSRIDSTVEAMIELSQRRESIRGMQIVESASTLRLFTAKFAELD